MGPNRGPRGLSAGQTGRCPGQPDLEAGRRSRRTGGDGRGGATLFAWLVGWLARALIQGTRPSINARAARPALLTSGRNETLAARARESRKDSSYSGRGWVGWG
jgi:hypothetical protein